MDVNEDSFRAEVVERSRELPVVVDFWADWCAPCRMLGPVLDREAAARDGAVMLAKVDIDANPGLAREYGVSGIPAVKAFRNGRVVDEFVGVRSPQSVAMFFDALTQPSEGQRLLDELGIEGEWPKVVEAVAAGDYETAFEWLLAELARADPEGKERVRRLMVALFADVGHDDPLVARYRRRLATALY